jgi:polysaccharide pyruvyl transferase WcaK-like protein
VAFLGVDFNDQYYSERSLEFLKKVRWISCRSKDQVLKLEAMTGRKDIVSHPDIAFSLPVKSVLSKESLQLTQKLLLNIVPLYGKIEKDKIVPLAQYASERPELYRNWDKIQNGYAELIRYTVDQYLSQGYSVESLPFTPMDQAAAGIILKGLSVNHHAYYPNPNKIIEIVKNANSFFATRYHATIFGLKANLKMIPFAYAKKNEQLMNDLQIHSGSYFQPRDFSDGYSPDRQLIPVSYNHDIVKQLQLAANQTINDCINHLLNDK